MYNGCPQPNFSAMDTQNLIWSHWKKEQKVFDTNLAVLKKHTQVEATHDLRVAVKKLRAYLKLYMLISGETEWEHLFKKTEDLFDVLGKQRDVEICLVLLAEYGKNNNCRFPELTNFFKQQLKKTISWANQSVHVYHKKEIARITLLLKEDLSLIDEARLADNICKIIDSHIAIVKNHFKQPHKVRQLLKEIYYWILILPGNIPADRYASKELHEVLDDLGRWQDHETLLTKEKHFRKDYMPASFDELIMLKEMEEKLKDGKKENVSVAINKVKKWIKNVPRNGVEPLPALLQTGF